MSIKISQLTETLTVGNNDNIPVARGGQETYRTPARQFVTAADNIGSGPGQFFITKIETVPTTLQFRTLSATGENITIFTQGNTVVISTSAQNPVKTTFTANGTLSAWPLAGFNSLNAANYRVDFDGVLQEPFVDYNISSGNIVFTAAPPLSTKVVIVSNNMVKVNEAQPAPNTITNEMMTDNSISTAELSANAVTTDKIALSAVGTFQLANGSVTTEKIALNAVGTTLLSAQSVTTLTIANSAVTAEKMSGGQTGNAPVYGCRAWVTFDGTRNVTDSGSSTNGNDVKIFAAGNVSRVNKIIPGQFIVVFNTAMPNTNFSLVGTSDGTTSLVQSSNSLTPFTTLSARIGTTNSVNGTYTDSAASRVSIQVFC